MFFSLIMMIAGMLSFSIYRKHLLLMLLSLEFIVLSLFFNMYMFMMLFDYEFYFLMVFLTVSVCEGVLGLSILVSMIRTHGGDYMNLFNILW
uniref:NADH-ubiquinone oxidoreductase chain 4L n=1 Tax=Diartiger fossulatus TaxID=1535458 RepID=A0A0S2M764_9COLE|nr:NADH deshydrogenase subunit 4L [Diartiger fossulatus]